MGTLGGWPPNQAIFWKEAKAPYLNLNNWVGMDTILSN